MWTQFFVELKNFYKLYSTQIMAALASLSVIEGYFHAFSVFLPFNWLPYITAAFALAAIIARFLPQDKVEADIRVEVHEAKAAEAANGLD